MSSKGVWILCLLSFSRLTNSAEESEAILDTTTSDTNNPQPDIKVTENYINNDEETEMVTEMATENVTTGIMEGKIVGGELTSLEENPHAAYLAITCKIPNVKKRFGCGSSILNHEILITAAHCLALCNSKSIIAIATASEHKYQGLNNIAKHFLVHPMFTLQTLAYDIALLRVRNKLTLGPRIKRVILMRNPPKIKIAYLAGWGLVDEKENISSKYLKMTPQKIISKKECKRIMKTTKGTICAKAIDDGNALYGHAAKGDSGSGLIGEDYILRGLVSYKNPKTDTAVSAFTDTAYYYDWIWQSTQQLMCVYGGK